MKVKANWKISHNGKEHKKNDPIELSEDEVIQLYPTGCIALSAKDSSKFAKYSPKNVEPEEPEDEDDFDEDDSDDTKKDA